MDKKNKHPDDDKEFVVINSKIGRLEKGIYCRHVRVFKDHAFVLPEGKSTQAEIVPAGSVFKTHKEAEKYLAGHGVRRWVVGEVSVGGGRQMHERHQVPMIFEANVVYYRYSGRYRVEERMAVERIENGKLVEVPDTYGMKAFETKEEAEERFKDLWDERLKDVQEHAAGYQSHLGELMRRAPNGAERPLPVPSPDILIGALKRIKALPNNNKLRSWRGQQAAKIAEDALKALGI